ncbi:MAG: hypothetical protein A3I61_01350 [Acidobacteria bacterium RIFCSPLOWO2_02_FULL_68_18]|nr:MAG: hypothetical protein A3I61_01350 [Acidobacteria bacterium RIFCSPLOWO2_02_FULL_68_18]OFW51560.1 MAG: hypothetical protein A3G77_18745 [Acidobacteria bacterium RIFCSPLOWO2_12_FULL_68_19]
MTGTHPLYLARELAAQGALAAYYTALPPSRTRGVPPGLVHRHLALLVPLYALMKGWSPISEYRLESLIEQRFDRWVSRHLVPADAVHALAGAGRRLRRAAKQRLGALAVCDSPTTHVRYRKALLQDEYARWGRPVEDFDDRKIESVEAEYAESDLILAPSRFAYQSFVSHGVPAAKLALTPYGVDCREFSPVPRTNSRFRILFVGNISIRKGVPYLLEAVSRLPWRDAELAFRGREAEGDPSLLAGYRGAIPLSVIPPQPRSELKQTYSNASVVVLPSIEDGFGLVIGQALACGTPVIATTHTGGPDLIEDGVNGFIVPPRDVDALVSALTRCYERRDALAEMGREARRRMERARGWGAYADSVVAACTQALGRRGTSTQSAAR